MSQLRPRFRVVDPEVRTGGLQREVFVFLLSDGAMSVCRFDFDARLRIGRFGTRPASLNADPLGKARQAAERAGS